MTGRRKKKVSPKVSWSKAPPSLHFFLDFLRLLLFLLPPEFH